MSEEHETWPGGMKKHWAVILGKVPKVFYYSYRDEAYQVIVDAFDATFGRPEDRETGEIYRLKTGEWRRVEMYYNVDGEPWPDKEINDPNVPWKDRKLIEKPRAERKSTYNFIGSWNEGGKTKERKLSFTAPNYRLALSQANDAMRRICRARRLPENAYSLKYTGSS